MPARAPQSSALFAPFLLPSIFTTHGSLSYVYARNDMLSFPVYSHGAASWLPFTPMIEKDVLSVKLGCIYDAVFATCKDAPVSSIKDALVEAPIDDGIVELARTMNDGSLCSNKLQTFAEPITKVGRRRERAAARDAAVHARHLVPGPP